MAAPGLERRVETSRMADCRQTAKTKPDNKRLTMTCFIMKLRKELFKKIKCELCCSVDSFSESFQWPSIPSLQSLMKISNFRAKDGGKIKSGSGLPIPSV